MTMSERIKNLRTATARLLANPLTAGFLPHDARAALADTAQLIGELVERVEKLERANNGQS